MKAIHGGQATHDTIDSPKMAVLLRGGMRPQADVYPAQRRATRDLLRRRMPLAPTRAERLAHVPQTNSPYHLPAIGQTMAYKANRDGVAERFADPAVHKSLAVDLTRIGHDDDLLRDVALPLVNAATHQDANTLYRLQTVPGMGQMRSLVRLDDISDINRFPRVQAFASDGRLVTCAKASHGQRSGSLGTNIGQAHLQWAFAEAAVLGLRDHPAGQTLLARWENKHRQGTA